MGRNRGVLALAQLVDRQRPRVRPNWNNPPSSSSRPPHHTLRPPFSPAMRLVAGQCDTWLNLQTAGNTSCSPLFFNWLGSKQCRMMSISCVTKLLIPIPLGNFTWQLHSPEPDGRSSPFASSRSAARRRAGFRAWPCAARCCSCWCSVSARSAAWRCSAPPLWPSW